MKKLMMTSDDYYNRRTEADYLEDELRSLRGCQSFFALMVVMAVLIALLLLTIL